MAVRRLSAWTAVVGIVVLAGGPGLEPASAQTPCRPPTPAGLDAYVPVPEENPLTVERVALGRELFHDPLLSRDRSRSCASCHLPERAFADSLAVSPGIEGRRSGRNAPTLLNRAWGEAFFWDGRASSLEEAVLMPITDTTELDLPIEELVRRLERSATYRRAFRRAFGESPSVEGISRALAAYVRTLRTGDAPVDRHLEGEATPLSPAARKGRVLFLGEAGCAPCHSGPNLTDEAFHNTGVSWGEGDTGRARVTGRAEDHGKFKTPTLREVALTAPYMHDGSLESLQEVVAFYDRGGGENPNLDAEIGPLELTAAERDRLVAFLRSLTGRERTDPAAARPGGPMEELCGEGDRRAGRDERAPADRL